MVKALNKPFRSTRKGKKYSVRVRDKGKIKTIHFGATGYGDFRSGTATQAQRRRYLARAKKIKNKSGQLTHKIRTSPNYWAVKYLWKG